MYLRVAEMYISRRSSPASRQTARLHSNISRVQVEIVTSGPRGGKGHEGVRLERLYLHGCTQWISRLFVN